MRFNVAALLRSPIGTTRREEVNAIVRVDDPEVEVIAPVRGTVRLIRDHAGILVDGVLSTRVRQPCARCLEPAESEVALAIAEHFHPTVALPGGPPVSEDPDEALDVATAIDELHVLDLAEMVRQALLIGAPLHPLCTPDCPGLCPHCGKPQSGESCGCEPPPDPRWEALRAQLDANR